MTPARCAICGNDELVEKHGTFEFAWPPGFAQATSWFADATWSECRRCKEQVLPPALIARIESET